MRKKVTVIMSVYNGEHCLRETIQSILGQTFEDFEFIIVNDGSTDQTAHILGGYNDSRIKIIHNDRNIGLTLSLNIGIKEALGEYIARQDSGDISLPERLQTQVDFLEDHPDIFLIGSGASIMDEKALRKALLKKCSILHPTIMFRNDKNTFYREKFKYSQDYDLYLRLLSKGKRMANTPEVLVKRSLSANSISFSKRAHQILFAGKALEFYLQREKYGNDKYDEFNPAEILSIDPVTSQDPKLIGHEIEAAFKLNDFKKVRSLYAIYRGEGPIVSKYVIYQLASFLPLRVLNLLRKIIWR